MAFQIHFNKMLYGTVITVKKVKPPLSTLSAIDRELYDAKDSI
jgi:hypothetical protein